MRDYLVICVVEGRLGMFRRCFYKEVTEVPCALTAMVRFAQEHLEGACSWDGKPWAQAHVRAYQLGSVLPEQHALAWEGEFESDNFKDTIDFLSGQIHR